MTVKQIVSSIMVAVTTTVSCFSVNVIAETENPAAEMIVVDQQFLAGSEKTDISKLTFGKIGNKVYTGKKINPSVTVKNGSIKLRSGKDYTVSYKNNTKIGTATITITGKGIYTGTKKLTFKIVPGKTAITANRSNDKVSLTWDKVKGATGYQVYYSDNGRKFTKLKTTTKTSFSTTKLEKDSSFQFKVRAYSRVNGKTYYGAFSDVVDVDKVNTADISIAIKDLGNQVEFEISGLDFSEMIDPLNVQGENISGSYDDRLYIGLYDKSSEPEPFIQLFVFLSSKSVQEIDFFSPPLMYGIYKWEYRLNDRKDSIVITLFGSSDGTFFIDNSDYPNCKARLLSKSKDCIALISSNSFNYTSSKEYANQTKSTFTGDLYFGDYKEVSITWK